MGKKFLFNPIRCFLAGVLIGFSLLALTCGVHAQSRDRKESIIRNKFIISIKENKKTSKGANASLWEQITSALVTEGVGKIKLEPLFPQFCRLSNKNGASLEVNHLRLVQAGIERLRNIDSAKVLALQRYPGRVNNKNFCNYYVLKFNGKKIRKATKKLKSLKFGSGMRINGAQEVRSYNIQKRELLKLTEKQLRPSAITAILSSQLLNKNFVGMRNLSHSEASNQRDDDLNGYVDDRFGINSNDLESRDEGESEGGFVTLAVARDRGDSVQYSSVEAAQAMLYSIHRGVEQLIIPFSAQDTVLNKLAGTLAAIGGSVTNDLSKASVEATANASSSYVTNLWGYITFDKDPASLGYKDDHFLMLALNPNFAYSGTGSDSKFYNYPGIKATLVKISSGFYRYEFKNAYSNQTLPPTKYAFQVIGAYFLCGVGGVHYTPILDLTGYAGQTVHGYDFACASVPGMTAKLKFSVGTVPGVEIDFIDFTPETSLDQSKVFDPKIFTGVDGKTEYSFPVGSLVRSGILDNWQAMGEPEESNDPYDVNLTYITTSGKSLSASGGRKSIKNDVLCYEFIDKSTGKPIPYYNFSGGKVDINQLSDDTSGSSYFTVAENGLNVKNCVYDVDYTGAFKAGAPWFVNYQKGDKDKYSCHGEGKVTLPTNVQVPCTISASTPTPNKTSTKTPTRTPTRNPTMTSTRGPEVSPTVVVPTVIPTIYITPVITPTVSVPMKTPTPYSTLQPRYATIEGVLTNNGVILSGYKVNLVIDGVVMASAISSSSGSVKFNVAPVGSIVLEPQKVEYCNWQYEIPMPFEDVQAGKPILQSFNLLCNKPLSTATPRAGYTVTPKPENTKTPFPTITYAPSQPSPTKTATRTPTPIKTMVQLPLITATPKATSNSTIYENVIGMIYDKTGKGMAGVNVVLRNSSYSSSTGTIETVYTAITDAHGRYVFNVVLTTGMLYETMVAPGVSGTKGSPTTNPDFSPSVQWPILTKAGPETILTDIQYLR